MSREMIFGGFEGHEAAGEPEGWHGHYGGYHEDSHRLPVSDGRPGNSCASWRRGLHDGAQQGEQLSLLPRGHGPHAQRLRPRRHRSRAHPDADKHADRDACCRNEQMP
jgi:hypothetical protein